MLKKISVLAFASLFVAGSAMASGYRIPEQSVDSTAKAGANVASATRADAAYFNPANMSWMEDTWHVQGNMSYIHLGKNEYTGTMTGNPLGAGSFSNNAEDENFLLPSMFIVSPDYNGFRFGLATVSPFGLAKRWQTIPSKLVSDEFSMQTVEINPSVAYKFNEKFSLSGGVRVLYSKAKVRNARYAMEGDTIEWGYNLAAAFKPTDTWNVSATYRSNIDMDFSQDDIVYNPMGALPIPGGGSYIINGSTSIPAPAVLTLSTSFEPVDKLTIELAIDRTFWSAYESFKLDSTTMVLGVIDPSSTTAKDWDDVNTYRISATYAWSDSLDLMAGLGYDECPSPDSTVSFELPDSDAWLFSAGFQYDMTENMEFGMAVLYDLKEDRSIDASAGNDLVGEFTNGSAWFVTVGMSYKF